jgi:alkylation response protein AidB-like acyl-CoA dehydrogenase
MTGLSTTRADPVAEARRLAADAAAQAAEGERARRLPPGLARAISEAGLFRLCVPASLGGLEAHPATLVRAVEALARGDGAAGWCVAIAATSGLVAGYLPPDAARAIYGDAAAVAGGVFAPKGRAVAQDDGAYAVSGRWPFASGCTHCDWLMGGCVVLDGETPRMLPNGMPDVRLMLAPSTSFTIHDTWHVSGLRATGSHDIELAGARIPAEHGASVFTDRPREEGPLYAFPLFGLLAIAIAAVSLGIARGALDELADLAGGKVPTGGRRKLAERGAVQAETAQAEAAVRGARALLLEAVEDAWERAAAEGEVDTERRTALRLASTHAAQACAEAATTAYRLGGGSAIYETSPLQRRFRDANVATQHMLVAPSTWELTGRLLLGLPTDTTQL